VLPELFLLTLIELHILLFKRVNAGSILFARFECLHAGGMGRTLRLPHDVPKIGQDTTALAADTHSDEVVGWHTAKLGDRWAALEPGLASTDLDTLRRRARSRDVAQSDATLAALLRLAADDLLARRVIVEALMSRLVPLAAPLALHPALTVCAASPVLTRNRFPLPSRTSTAASSPDRRPLDLASAPNNPRTCVHRPAPLLGVTRAQTAAYCTEGGRAWREDASSTSEPARGPISKQPGPVANVVSMAVEPFPDDEPSEVSRVRGTKLGPLLGAQTWAATLFELAPGDATAPYHYEWCREEWVLELAGAPTLRHPEGEDVLDLCDIVCFPEGPAGAHGLLNHSKETVRLIIFSTPTGRPMSAAPAEGPNMNPACHAHPITAR